MNIVHALKMKFFITFVTLVTLIYCINAQDCLPVNDPNFILPNWYYNTPITHAHEGVVAIITVEGLTGTSDSTSPYLKVSNPENNEFTVSVTDEFRYFEENSGSSTDIIIFITLTCSGSTASISFIQPIIDINSAPIFSQAEYRYYLPMPFPAGIDITQFGFEIIARDIDITPTTITFEINSDSFNLIGQGTTDYLMKNHRAILVTTRSLQFTETAEFQITATDSGGLSATATVIIEIDKENSVECCACKIF